MTASAWRPFDLRVSAVTTVTPHLRRVTLAGDDLDRFADVGADCRIKLLLPPAPTRVSTWAALEDWRSTWAAMPEAERPALRTYTVRDVRGGLGRRELDVDMVLHPHAGPAGTWAARARRGDALTVVGPDRWYAGDHGGRVFRLPTGATEVLLAGDETALPAVSRILAGLPPDAPRAHVLLEVPSAEDVHELEGPEDAVVEWLPRAGALPGDLLCPRVREWAGRRARGTAYPSPETPTDESDAAIVWEVPGDEADTDAAGTGAPYVWVAAETSVVRSLRRHLRRELGMPRANVAVMGYWRRGSSLDD